MGSTAIEHQLLDSIGKNEALDPLSDQLQTALNNLYDSGGQAGQGVEDFLQGAWFGHPLHPVLVTIPIGAWTVTEVLDVVEATTGSREYAAGADAALTIGLVGAVASAVTGMTNWKDSDGEAKREGLVHGLLNLGAAALYAGSLAARRNGNRGTGRQLSLLGYLTVLASGYLGGDLSYRHRIGIDNSQFLEAQQLGEFRPVLDEAELGEGQLRSVEVDGVEIVLARQDGQVFALGNRCAHLGGPLAEGKLEAGCVVCPWHGSRFALADGALINSPSTYPQPHFATRVRNGKIEVRYQERAALQQVAPPALSSTERLVERQLGDRQG